MLDRPGEFLYHYTRLDTALEHILPTRRLRLSPFSAMRDPRESHLWGLAATIYEAAPDDDDLFWEINRQMNAVKSRIKVLSLTHDDPQPRELSLEIFGRGFAHPRLWEHYANNHLGVCLCLEQETLIEVLTRELTGQGQLEHDQVAYEDAPIVREALHVDLAAVRARGVDTFLSEHVAEHHRELFFKKVCDWESEMEYRFVLDTDHEEPVDVDVSQPLKAVVLGAQVAPVYLPALRALCDPYGVQLIQIRWMNGRPLAVPPPEEGSTVITLDGISFPAAPPSGS